MSVKHEEKSPQQRVTDWLRSKPIVTPLPAAPRKPSLVAIDGQLVCDGNAITVVVSPSDPNWRPDVAIFRIEPVERDDEQQA
jgi:hypothetical protein